MDHPLFRKPLFPLSRRNLLTFPPQLLLGVMTIGPWALFLVYDMMLYIIRAVAYEVPYFGGRARGRRRPRAPSLVERPNGRRRTFSFSGPSSGFMVGDENDKAGLKRRGLDGSLRDEAGAISEEEEAEDITIEGGYSPELD